MMGYAKAVLTFAILSTSLLCGEARATERPPRPAQTAPKADTEPPPAPKKKPIKRRAVHQIVDGMPAYGPRLVPQTPIPLPSTLPPSAMPPPARSQINSCDAGGCTDTTGTRYQGGVGTTLLSPGGRLCSNNGATVQCF